MQIRQGKFDDSPFGKPHECEYPDAKFGATNKRENSEGTKARLLIQY